MDVVVKVVLDQKEYDRLLEIERKYNALSNQQSSAINQGGGGADSTCSCQRSPPPLSQVIAENIEKHALKQPIPGILPSITSPEDITPSTSGSQPKSYAQHTHIARESHSNEDDIGFYDGKKMYPWYFIGTPKKN